MGTFHRIWAISLRIDTGPPTWWKPNGKIKRTAKSTEVRFGWLRMAVQITVGKTKVRG